MANGRIAKPDQSNFLRRFSFADSRFLVAAVVDIYDHYAAEKKDAGSDKWFTNRRYYAQEMCNDVCTRWCEITGEGIENFPWDIDFVAALWMSFRKEADARKNSLRRELMTFCP